MVDDYFFCWYLDNVSLATFVCLFSIVYYQVYGEQKVFKAELSVGPFCMTQPIPTHHLSDPTRPNLSICDALGRVGSLIWWVVLGRVIQNGPTDNSALNSIWWLNMFLMHKLKYLDPTQHNSVTTCDLKTKTAGWNYHWFFSDSRLDWRDNTKSKQLTSVMSPSRQSVCNLMYYCQSPMSCSWI